MDRSIVISFAIITLRRTRNSSSSTWVDSALINCPSFPLLRFGLGLLVDPPRSLPVQLLVLGLDLVFSAFSVSASAGSVRGEKKWSVKDI